MSKLYGLTLAILAVGLPVGGWGQSPTMDLKPCPVVFAKDADSSGPAVSERDCGVSPTAKFYLINGTNVSNSLIQCWDEKARKVLPCPTAKPTGK